MATRAGLTQLNATCVDVEGAGAFNMGGPLGGRNVTSGSLTADSIMTQGGGSIDVGWD